MNLADNPPPEAFFREFHLKWRVAQRKGNSHHLIVEREKGRMIGVPGQNPAPTLDVEALAELAAHWQYAPPAARDLMTQFFTADELAFLEYASRRFEACLARMN